jgi:hypothetical protein
MADLRVRDALDRLDRSPCGDVLAARACARALLQDGASPDGLAERLLLTAVLMDLQARAQGVGSPEELFAVLRRLARAPGSAAGFAASPLAVVRLIAAELAEGGLTSAAGRLADRWRQEAAQVRTGPPSFTPDPHARSPSHPGARS